jgi:hypothetical protein
MVTLFNTVNTSPQPRIYDLFNDNGAYYAAPRAVEITTRITVGPPNTQMTVTLLQPTTPSWQKLLSDLGE